MKKWLPHGVVLVLLSLAEGSRLFEFYQTLSGNMLAGIASAAITVGIVFYLAFFGYRWASIGATILCIALSFASFVDPLLDEFAREEKSHPVQELLKYPAYNPKSYWNGGREAYVEAFKLETELVKKENARIMAENAKIQTKRELSLYFWHLLLGAVVLAVCVPILNYLVSHKIAEVHSSSITVLSYSHRGDFYMTATKKSPKKTVSHETVAQDDIDFGDNEKTSDKLQDGDRKTVVSHGYSRIGNEDDGDSSSNRQDDATNRDAEILQRFQSKVPAPKIAKEFGISRQHVYKIVKKMQRVFEIPAELKFA
ncbi:helix-turn-helix domain containing protein [Leptospira interrogans]|uniref:helix-turn-helix domain-containing protein n=1 Tax=Leptospira interrogans TaxID=173 RepID=UPI001F4C7555|nr:helix-turn-helix domain-containing protein [Leptospira interrogans]UNE66877.1 helix-turn-helix domain containing protein [Leptospira interrogans]